MSEERKFMMVDGMPVEINGERNLLEVIRKVGIKMPTFCYHSDLSIYVRAVCAWLRTNGAGLMRLAQPRRKPE